VLDLSHLPTGTGPVAVQEFFGQATVLGASYQTWVKPRGKTMCSILLSGKGGNGGTGVIGATSTAAGGGGGGSGGQTSLTMPLALLPDVLYLSLAGQSATTTLASTISIQPSLTAGGAAPVANNVLMIANGGGNGGNASGATAGTAGTAGAIATVTTMPLGWQWANLSLAGQAGIAGGGVSAGAALTLPLTGLTITGGTGGAGISSTGTPGAAGGAITGAGLLPSSPGGIGGAAATTPPTNGGAGFNPIPKLRYFYGGTGGGSTHADATGAGAVQASGGNGAPGSGGGGMGGALTGSTAGAVGQGGVAYCLIVCW